MFGLDLISIIAAGIAGGIGGALGGLLGLLTTSRQARLLLVVVPAVAGSQILKPLIVPVVEQFAGTSVRGGQFEATYENEVLPEIKKIPALERIFREHPDVEAKFRAKAKE